MNTNIINRHLYWISQGYCFEDVQNIRQEIRDLSPYSTIGTKAIHHRIGGSYSDNGFSKADLEKLTFLLVDDGDFDGDIHFLKHSRNLEKLFISGLCSEKKISDLRPLRKLEKLQHLHMDHQQISDLSALSNLQNLREIHLYKNPIESIRPIIQLKNLRKAEFSGVYEEEIFQLLQSSRSAKVSFTSRDDKYSYDAYWMNGWAYKTTYLKEQSSIVTTIEPMPGVNETKYSIPPPQQLRLMLIRSQEIAQSLLSEKQSICDSEFTYKEKTHLLIGRFKYYDTEKRNFDFQESRN